jgi:leader peptidase (prepilin peptidase)/N-methyltransferase
MADSVILALPVILAFAFGLLIGSFLNVVIYRLPRDLSVVLPRSHCPGCQSRVRAWDNIPVMSYMLLGGKCRDCGMPISIRYPIVESLTGIVFAWFIATRGLTLVALRDCVLAALFLALAFTDLETRLLPEPLTVGGIAVGLGFSIVVPLNDGIGQFFGLAGWVASLANSVIGALLPAFLLWSLGWLFEKIRHKEGLGFGDVVMVAEVGAFLGLQAAFLTLVLASVLGSIIGVLFIWLKRENPSDYELPLGTFLGFSAIVVASAGDRFIQWYAGFF